MSEVPVRGEEPAFLRALDQTATTPDGWTARCPVFGCLRTLHITASAGHYRLECGDHTHQEVVDYLQCDTRTPDERTWGIRAWEALMLAPTPEAWEQLLLGNPVPEDQLNPLWLRRFKARRMT